MKRRLRKKQLGKDGFDQLLDTFVVETVEANGCFCGVGGSGNRLDVSMELRRTSDDREVRLGRLRAWSDASDDVATHQVGPECDLWPGDCPEVPPSGDDGGSRKEAAG